MQQNVSRIHQGLAWLVLAGLALQFYLAGTALFGVGSFESHRMLGSILMLPALLLLILALVGRLGRRLVGLSIALTLLMIVQGMLPSLRDNASWIAALHPVTALGLLGISSTIGRTRLNEPTQAVEFRQ